MTEQRFRVLTTTKKYNLPSRTYCTNSIWKLDNRDPKVLQVILYVLHYPSHTHKFANCTDSLPTSACDRIDDEAHATLPIIPRYTLILPHDSTRLVAQPHRRRMVYKTKFRRFLYLSALITLSSRSCNLKPSGKLCYWLEIHDILTWVQTIKNLSWLCQFGNFVVPDYKWLVFYLSLIPFLRMVVTSLIGRFPVKKKISNIPSTIPQSHRTYLNCSRS